MYSKSPQKAKKILSIGNAPSQTKGAINETAAYVDVVMALLNTDEFITRK